MYVCMSALKQTELWSLTPCNETFPVKALSAINVSMKSFVSINLHFTKKRPFIKNSQLTVGRSLGQKQTPRKQPLQGLNLKLDYGGWSHEFTYQMKQVKVTFLNNQGP